MSSFRSKGWQQLVIAAGLAALQCGSLVSAQVASGNKLPEALKDVKPADGVCRRDSFSPAEDGKPAVAEVAPDFACAITAAELLPILASPNTALIDLRLGAEHQAFHIAGAMSLNTADLHSKPYWQRKTTVLIGNGKGERELYSECARLKRSGYSAVKVLRGGMASWLANNQSVSGQAPRASQLARLTASELWIESQSPANLVVLGAEMKALQNELPYSTVLPQTTGPAIKSVLERRRKELKDAPLAAVVLAVDLGMSNDDIQRLQQSLGPLPLLVYTDTREALQRHVSMQKAIWAAQARGPKQPACGT